MDRSRLAHEHLRLGREPADDEHGVQLELLEALQAALGPGGRRGGAADLVGRLLVFSDMHFGSEELLMRLDAYPRYGEHVEEHRRLLDQLRELEARVRDGRDARDLADALRRGFGGHIATHDRALAGYHPGA